MYINEGDGSILSWESFWDLACIITSWTYIWWLFDIRYDLSFEILELSTEFYDYILWIYILRGICCRPCEPMCVHIISGQLEINIGDGAEIFKKLEVIMIICWSM